MRGKEFGENVCSFVSFVCAVFLRDTCGMHALCMKRSGAFQKGKIWQEFAKSTMSGRSYCVFTLIPSVTIYVDFGYEMFL